jgi:hypothetical protein
MANTTIAIKKSATGSAVPSSLVFGELAINYADGKIYYKNVNSSIVEFSPTTGGTNSFGTVNANSTLVIADSPGGILTFIAGDNISIVGDAINDRITVSANLSPALTVANAAFGKANTAETTAIAAFAKANSSGGGIAISTDNATNNTFFVTLSTLTTGTATTLNVATTKLTFNPSSGTLSATVFNSLSDRSYKANVRALVNSLDIVDNLRGVSFNWKDSGQASIGVIAQEIEAYVPSLVTDNNGIKNVNYDGIIGLLIESIKELKDRIEVLEYKQRNL